MAHPTSTSAQPHRCCVSGPSRAPSALRSALRWLLLTLVAALLSGCPSKERLGYDAMNVLSEGVINDPRNKSLRFDLLKFGFEQFCTEMRRRGAALKLRDGEPVVGRFFATSCQSDVIDAESKQSFIVQYAGQGYGWTNLTGRLGFTSAGLAEYAADFRLHEGSMYVYFRPRQVDVGQFSVTMVESLVAQTGMQIAQIDPNQIGRNIVDSQLRRGFTVIRHSARGETAFALGLVPPGQVPFHPFQVVRSDKITLDNDRTEVHIRQQDVIGGFYVPESGQSLFLNMTVDGTTAVDVFLIQKQTGDVMLQSIVGQAGATPLPGAPLYGEMLSQGVTLQRQIPVPAGEYYMVIDNSAAAGQAFPPNVPFDDRAARVDYLVQLGDAD